MRSKTFQCRKSKADARMLAGGHVALRGAGARLAADARAAGRQRLGRPPCCAAQLACVCRLEDVITIDITLDLFNN